jgi:hypothetical protein
VRRGSGERGERREGRGWDGDGLEFGIEGVEGEERSEKGGIIKDEREGRGGLKRWRGR